MSEIIEGDRLEAGDGLHATADVLKEQREDSAA
jgi:hypothetical protein